jgi:hypothetical protein
MHSSLIVLQADQATPLVSHGFFLQARFLSSFHSAFELVY